MDGWTRPIALPSPLTWSVIAKFHYTDPTQTGPDTDEVRAHCRRRAKFHYTDTDTDPTRTRPDPHGPARTFFAAKLRWVRAGPCRVRVVEFSFYTTECPVLAPGRNAPLIRFLISALCILFTCLYRMIPHLSFFLHFFLTYLLPYLSFPLRIEPLRFQAG